MRVGDAGGAKVKTPPSATSEKIYRGGRTGKPGCWMVLPCASPASSAVRWQWSI